MHRPFANAPGVVLGDDAGRIEIWIDRPGWVLCRITGRFEDHHCSELLLASDRALTTGSRLRFVHDWRRMTGFDMASASRMVAWSATHLRRIEHATIVAHSPLVLMGARAANVTLNRLLTLASDDAELERALAPW